MFALTPLLALALLLRLWGMGQGYPDFYGHVDEVGVAASIWNFFRNATLEPTEFTYPALFSYIVALGIWLTAALGWVDLPAGGRLLERIAFLSYTDPGWSALTGRAVSALASTAMVGVMYRVGHQVDGRSLAWAAAAFSAVAVVPVRMAHHALPDSLTSLFGALVLLLAVRLAQRDRALEYVWAGVCVGLLLATKYNGAFCALAVVAANGWRRGWRGAVTGVHLWMAGGTAVLACGLGSPYLVLAWERYLGVAEYQVSSLGFSMRQTTPWLWVPRGLATEEWLVGGWMLAGVGLALWRRRASDCIALAALAPAVLYIGSWTRESLHYLLPYYPMLVLLAAGAVVALSRRLPRPGLALPVLLVLTAGPSLWRAAAEAHELNLPDTRSLAGDWVERNIPGGSTLGMTWLPYCPRLDLLPVRQSILQYYAGKPDWQAELQRRWSGRPAYKTVNLEAWLSRPVVPAALQDVVDLEDAETRRVFSRGWRSRQRLRTAGVTHLVLPAAVYERYFQEAEPPTAPAARFRYLMNRAYFHDLLYNSDSELLVTVPASAEPQTRGNTIAIFRLR